MPSKWDVIVIGAGHAGCEAALAAAKMGQRTLLLTQSVDQVGAMSCNPAIGGLAKGHLVKEIDAIGGAMGLAADATGIQFRTLNETKGAAVQATRCQSDMIAYKAEMRRRIESQENLDLKQSEVTQLAENQGQIEGVVTQMGEQLSSKAVIITTGTFLNGLIHIGDRRFPAGRAWDFASLSLPEHLKALGLKMGRMKTGTTPRLDKRTIDFSQLEVQPGSSKIRPFSFWETSIPLPQVPCHITYTGAKSQEIIERNIHLSAMYSGAITGIGPRYCPSIEDKISKFPDKLRHQIFLEPTSLQSNEIYPNGMSTSLPLEVQIEFMRSIKGLEQVEIVRPGYAIEYDFVHPTQLKSTLEVKSLPGLYCAGQINGTSGYEEAAAQGLMAGINAALKNQGKEPLILTRNQAYIGVLIDDLVSLGTEEPYRMFTSRAEYRLLLREDNADTRLSPIGRELGLLNEAQWERFTQKQDSIAKLQAFTKEIRLTPNAATIEALGDQAQALLPHKLVLADFLKRGGGTIELAKALPEQDLNLDEFDPVVLEYVETEIKYAGYVTRQESQVKKYLNMDAVKIPETLKYSSIAGLSKEVVQKLMAKSPQNLGQAAKISGVTPAAIAILHGAIEKGRRS